MTESDNSDSAPGGQTGTASSLANQSNERVTNVLKLLKSATTSIFAQSRVVTSNTKKNTERRGSGKASVKTSRTVKTVSGQRRIREF